MPDTSPGPLEGIRILDLSTEPGLYCGKLLADIGADCIKVEPPGGDNARGLGPFFHDEVGRETSLTYWYFNTNKRFVTCNIDEHDGQHLFRELVKSADVVLESFTPGHMESRGIGYEQLKALKPDLVYISISPFGLDGPHRDWKTADIVTLAMAGVLTLAGDPTDPPNRMFGNQAYISSSIAAAEGAALALFHRERTGEGQLVEVSMQEALSIAQETAMMTWDFQKTSRQRNGELIRLPGLGTYQSADGYIYSMVGISGFGAPWTVLLDWMDDEGKAENLKSDPEYLEFLQSMNMRTLTALLMDPDAMAAKAPILNRIQEIVTAFYRSKTSMELYESGQGRRLLIGIISSPKDLLENPHLQAREWYQTTEFRGETVTYPGPPFRFMETPITLRRTVAPVGAHNLEVWSGETGVPLADLELFLSEGAL